ncbi:hypothetical protein KC19_7G034200 [Ceratodon purpureus]|uniref:Uncharacterized protein n=1 Tax=Ceratodon purpureus TaxID=3225 RepID=A0A8T0H786_CERPU|nr:hypothetical protein KC19_7G034200 [Ceratodon purpureus]
MVAEGGGCGDGSVTRVPALTRCGAMRSLAHRIRPLEDDDAWPSHCQSRRRTRCLLASVSPNLGLSFSLRLRFLPVWEHWNLGAYSHNFLLFLFFWLVFSFVCSF